MLDILVVDDIVEHVVKAFGVEQDESGEVFSVELYKLSYCNIL